MEEIRGQLETALFQADEAVERAALAQQEAAADRAAATSALERAQVRTLEYCILCNNHFFLSFSSTVSCVVMYVLCSPYNTVVDVPY